MKTLLGVNVPFLCLCCLCVCVCVCLLRVRVCVCINVTWIANISFNYSNVLTLFSLSDFLSRAEQRYDFLV